MQITKKILYDLQKRLKVGNRKGVHLNAIPGNSRYKFDLYKLSHIDKSLPSKFIHCLLTELPLKFKVSWNNNDTDLNSLFNEDQTQLASISKSFENLINQTETIESEKGINTFGFGFPLFVRRDIADNKLTVAPVLIWSLRIKRLKDFNTWEINRSVDDPIYLNEVLINHLENDAKIKIDQIPDEMLDDGLLSIDELATICINLIKTINPNVSPDIIASYTSNITNVVSIKDKTHYENLTSASSAPLLHFSGLFSIFEVQKQNIINEYESLIKQNISTIDLDMIEKNYFQPLSSVKTDPSQQGILNSIESVRNVLIQGPPGTGKSQTLTALLLNALENNRKTIVVCEKRTALEVLHDALIKKGLQYNCILIRDVVKDRRMVVDSVRDRVDGINYKSFKTVTTKQSLNNILRQAHNIITIINEKHKKLDNKLLGESTWSDVVGLLLSELRDNDDINIIDYSKFSFSYSTDELYNLSDIVNTGEGLYHNFQVIVDKDKLNNNKFSHQNPYQLKDTILSLFKDYKSELMEIKYIHDNRSFFQKLYFPFLAKKIKNIVMKVQADGWISSFTINTKENIELITKIDIIVDEILNYLTYKSEDFFYEYQWYTFYNKLTPIQKEVVNSLKSKLNWSKTFVYNYLNSLLIINADRDWQNIEQEYPKLSKVLSKIENEQLKYIKNFWFSKQMESATKFYHKNAGFSVENLYNKKSSFKNARHTLRQIINKDIDLFTTFFPVILTTPDVCCNLFKGNNNYFDIVMFDEASQLRLEDNLPAILKGKQVLVAGDEQQMPPSNYFSKVFEGSIEDEEEIDEEEEIVIDKANILLSCESLLDFAREIGFEKRHLDFHYRSKHPFLIDFSNYAFYKNRLKPMPNKYDYTPIKFIQVNGFFINHTNELEAEMVLSILEHNINRLPSGAYPSVGIATLNIAQRDLIHSKIIERQKFTKYSNFNNKIQELQNTGLFIKNLENIQGDEMDVIILSTTYGVGKDSKFVQRFGPLNHSKGYKLLNVIITRAKYKVYLCTSVPEEVFTNYKEYLKQEGSNNRKAVFYAYLAYCKAVSENNSEGRLSVLNALRENDTPARIYNSSEIGNDSAPFIEEIYNTLVSEFGSDKVFKNYQFAGFKIDIVFKSNNVNGRRIAIECDGNDNHSSSEAYLFDLYRQEILEEQGYVFHRIWSTNFWNNYKKEIAILLNFIRNIEAEEVLTDSNTSYLKNTFTDTIITDIDSQSGIKEINSEQILVPGQKLSNQAIPKINQKTTIKLNSKVEVKYINNGKNIKFHIVDKAPSRELKSGLQQINIKSPLAVSIVGHSVGDVVKIGNLDNYVEIIKVEN